MPRKDPVAQAEYMRGWYARSSAPKEKAMTRKARYQARNGELVRELLARGCPACGSGDAGHLETRTLELLRLARVPCSVARIREAASICSEQCPSGKGPAC